MGSSTVPTIITVVAVVLALALLIASFTGHMRWPRSRTGYMGRVSKWVRVRDPAGDEWQLISYRTGSVPPVGAPTLMPGPLKLLGEAPGAILDGLVVNQAVFRGGFTVAVGPHGSRVGNVETRRCRDREAADALVDRLTVLLQNGSWNPDWRQMPEEQSEQADG